MVDAGVEENVADPLHLSEIDHPRLSGLLAVQPHLFNISQLLSASAYLWAAEKSRFFLASRETFDKKHDVPVLF